MVLFIALGNTSRNEEPTAFALTARPRKIERNSERDDAIGKTETLIDLGFREVVADDVPYRPVLRERQYSHYAPSLARFQRLRYLDAYIVETSNPNVANRARAALEPEYRIVSDLRLSSAELPLALSHRTLDAKARGSWYAASKIDTAHASGITGQGVIVGVLDTGCDADHVELANKRVQFRHIPFSLNSAIRDVRGFDVANHGTHACGIIAGQSVGIAPGVDLMVASVIESETLKTSLSRIMRGLDWMLSIIARPENNDRPAIINMSLGIDPRSVSKNGLWSIMSNLASILDTLIVDFDALPIVAIGNSGPNMVSLPGALSQTLSVGAVDSNLHPASFSGGGFSPYTGTLQPDLVGYGVDIFSSVERDIDNKHWYARMSGTSMATPYVTGIAALLASAHKLAGDSLRQHVLTTALPLAAAPDRVGAGLARFL